MISVPDEVEFAPGGDRQMFCFHQQYIAGQKQHRLCQRPGLFRPCRGPCVLFCVSSRVREGHRRRSVPSIQTRYKQHRKDGSALWEFRKTSRDLYSVAREGGRTPSRRTGMRACQIRSKTNNAKTPDRKTDQARNKQYEDTKVSLEDFLCSHVDFLGGRRMPRTSRQQGHIKTTSSQTRQTSTRTETLDRPGRTSASAQ